MVGRCPSNLNKMKVLNPLKSLEFFKDNLPKFLSKDGLINDLIVKVNESLLNNSDNFHASCLENGKELMKHIIAESIGFLSNEIDSPKNRSIKSIKNYIDAFTVFEEMLFGLDQTYRDHTLHSLWVYLYGHEFIVNMGGYSQIEIAGQMFIDHYNQDGTLKLRLQAETIKGKEEHLEATWGMIAILHDLGYPIEAISNKPQEVFGKILDPFALDFMSFFQIDYASRISLLYQNISDLVSTMYRPRGLDENEREELYKKYEKKGQPIIIKRYPTTSKDEAHEMEFKIASVDKRHAAWSAILAFKNIKYLHESDYRGGGVRNYLKLLTRRDILSSILHHISEEPADIAVNRFQFILLLIDDIEEAARYSRGGKLRGVLSEFCDIKWIVNNDKATIELDYTNFQASAEKKYNEMLEKYKFQISNDRNSGYVITIVFIDNKNNFNKNLSLYLVKDEK